MVLGSYSPLLICGCWGLRGGGCGLDPLFLYYFTTHFILWVSPPSPTFLIKILPLSMRLRCNNNNNKSKSMGISYSFIKTRISQSSCFAVKNYFLTVAYNIVRDLSSILNEVNENGKQRSVSSLQFPKIVITNQLLFYQPLYILEKASTPPFLLHPTPSPTVTYSPIIAFMHFVIEKQ